MVRCCTCMRSYHLVCIGEKTEGFWNCPSCRTLPFTVSELMDLVRSLSSELNAYKSQTTTAIDELTNECKLLRLENAKLTEQLTNPSHPPTMQAPYVAKDIPKSFADVVKASVQSVIHEEKVRSDVILINVKDAKQDFDDVKTLCADIGFPSNPIATQRLGKSQENRERLLKVSFGNAFDARAFQAKFNEAKKDDNPRARGVRCRPGRTKAEQDQYSKLNKTVHNLNVDSSDGESYSLRPNGQIWKFAKSDEGHWKRVPGWSYKPPSPGSPAASGNSQGTPQSNC